MGGRRWAGAVVVALVAPMLPIIPAAVANAAPVATPAVAPAALPAVAPARPAMTHRPSLLIPDGGSTPRVVRPSVAAVAGCTINFDNSAGTGAWFTATNWDL